MKCKYEETGDCSGAIIIQHAMTAYHFEGVLNSEEDPNKDFMACERHYEDYERFWQDQWDEYYGIVREGIQGEATRRETSYVDEGPSPQDLLDDFVSRIHFK